MAGGTAHRRQCACLCCCVHRVGDGVRSRREKRARKHGAGRAQITKRARKAARNEAAGDASLCRPRSNKTAGSDIEDTLCARGTRERKRERRRERVGKSERGGTRVASRRIDTARLAPSRQLERLLARSLPLASVCASVCSLPTRYHRLFFFRSAFCSKLRGVPARLLFFFFFFPPRLSPRPSLPPCRRNDREYARARYSLRFSESPSRSSPPLIFICEKIEEHR